MSAPPPLTPSALVAGSAGQIMRDLTGALRDARAALTRETDPERQTGLRRLIEEVRARAAPISAYYAKVCLDMAIRDRPVAATPGRAPAKGPRSRDPLGQVDLADLGFRFAEALSRFDPRIHGDEVARHEMLEVLISEFVIPDPRPQA